MRSETLTLSLAIVFGMMVCGGMVRISEERQQPMLVITTASWCEPCKKLKRDIENNPDVVHGFVVEIVEDDSAASVPRLEIIVNGGVIKEAVGYRGIAWLRRWIKGS